MTKTWGEYAQDKMLPEKLRVKCGECGRDFEMGHDAIVWWAKCNDVLAERGEAPLVTREVARCQDCYLVHRLGDPMQTQRDRLEVLEVIRELRKGKVVSGEVMGKVLVGQFGSSLEEAVKSLRMGSTRDQSGKRGKNADAEALNDD